MQKFLLLLISISLSTQQVWAQNEDVKLREDVLRSIKQAQRYLKTSQRSKGDWKSVGASQYPVGVTSLALLALVNSGLTEKDPTVRKALGYLRELGPGKPTQTYELSVMISALVAAKAKDNRDHALINALATRLEKGQLANGSWSYSSTQSISGGDQSNAQFGLLGLRDAATIGFPVDQQTWIKADRYWRGKQRRDGGWAYNGSGSTGSMTCAGIASLAITRRMLRNDLDVNPDGTVKCCQRPAPDDALDRGLDWIGRRFSARSNPGRDHGDWTLYYLYAMERAGRLTARRFVGPHDWYREGARHLAMLQRVDGDWTTSNRVERKVVGASLGLLFLSKGLVPVVINKLQYGTPDPKRPDRPATRDWDNHPDDVRNLVELIGGLDDWPRLLTHQTVNVHRLQPDTAVAELAQAPICYISGAQRPAFSQDQVAALRAYVDQGGFILAMATCDSQDFDPGFRELIQRMFPEGGSELKRLESDHPIFRSEYRLPADAIELYGLDFGCRTPIVYSPVDLACYWNKWMKIEPRDRKKLPQAAQDRLRTRIARDTRIGVNIVAYATGREPPNKLDDTGAERIKGKDQIARGLLEIGKLKHSGGWDTAPRALRNLLVALNETVGLGASTKPKALPVMSDDIYNYPLLYMHGRHAFQLSSQERKRLKEYLSRGNVLFADACCGSIQFDKSFRTLMMQMFDSDAELVRIPIDHEFYADGLGHDIRQVDRRIPAVGRNARFEARVERGEPFLEGVTVDGRLVVIYSKYDLSCALERQSTAACRGYVEQDAVKIAMKIVLYAMNQDVP
ncbi:MAG: DUF4159 domain-containing protein [Planctomycetaceae bacterium]